MMKNIMLFGMAIIGATMIGAHFGSPWVGIGVYLCVAAAGNWK